MVRRGAISKGKVAGGALIGAVASSLAAAALSAAGTADATCASISGVGAGGGCTSTPTSFALGLGNGATASSNGLFSGAVAMGDGATAVTNGNFNAALAVGKNSFAQAGANANDTGNLAVNIGNNAPGPNATGSFPGAFAGNDLGTPGFGNVAIVTGNNNAGSADGSLDSVFNIGGTGNTLISTGFANNATNVLGNNNWVQAAAGTGPTNPGLSSAFNIGGNNNYVYAGSIPNISKAGPFAIAGAIGTSNHDGITHPVINQPTTGITIKTALNP